MAELTHADRLYQVHHMDMWPCCERAGGFPRISTTWWTVVESPLTRRTTLPVHLPNPIAGLIIIGSSGLAVEPTSPLFSG